MFPKLHKLLLESQARFVPACEQSHCPSRHSLGRGGRARNDWGLRTQRSCYRVRDTNLQLSVRQVSSNVFYIRKALSCLHICLPSAHWMGFQIQFPDFVMLLRLTLARETQQSYHILLHIYLLIYCVCGVFMCVLLHMHVCARSWRGYRLTLHVISGSHSYF